MMELSTLFVACVLMTAGAYAGSVEFCKVTPALNCPHFTLKSDLVSVPDLMDQNMTSDGWIMIYGSDFGSNFSHGKCNYRWTPSKLDNTIQRQTICYNFELGKCESFDAKLTWQDDGCGSMKEVSVDNTETGTYYSQDIQQYLLYYTCSNYTSSDLCDIEYLDILVRDYRYRDSIGKELDLQGVPWHLLAVDLKKNFGFEFSSQEVKFHWKGPECDFDGNIVTTETNHALRPSIDTFVLLYVMIMTCSFLNILTFYCILQ